MIPFTLRQVEYVVAVADTLSFRGAAQRCHVSQPALSVQIRQLEESLGVTIFERDRRGVLVTAAGQDVVARARGLLIAADDLGRVAQRHGAALEGTLRLGVIPTIAPYALPHLLPRLRERYPKLRLLLREDRTPELVAALFDGQLDLLLLAEEADLGAVASAFVARDPFLLAVPAGHRLAGKKTVRQRDLAEQIVLVLEDGHCFGEQALAVCHRNHAHDGADFRASSLTTLVQMVAGDVGVTLLPKLAVEVENRSHALVTRDLGEKAPARTIVVAWRPTSPSGSAYRELAEALRAWWPAS